MELFRLFGTIGLNGVEETQDDIEETTDQAEQAEPRMSGAFKRIGQAVVTYLAVDKIIDFGKSIVEASATVSAEASAFTQIMGDYSDEAQEKINKIADTTGMVSTRLTPYMTSMTAKFKGLGFDINQATTLASDGLLLASDASAFWDKSLEDSMSALNSFINGSYEGGEAIGLFANDTQLASYAVKEGIVKEAKEWANLEEAKKQATRLEFAKNMFDASGATGQASKEADQYANVQANLNEKWRQFKAEIGEPLLQNVVLPAMDKLSGVVDKLSSGYKDLTKWISENKTTVQILIGVFASATAGLVAYKSAMTAMAIVKTVTKWLDGMTLSQKLLNIAMSMNPIGIVIALIGALVTAFIYFWNTSEEFRNFWIELWNSIKETFNAVVTWIQDKFNAVVTWIQDKFNAFSQWFTTAWDSISTAVSNTWNSIVEFVTGAWETIKNVVQVGLMFLEQLFNLFIDILLVPWNFIWQNFGDKITSAWEKIKSVVQKGLDYVTNIISNVMNAVQEKFTSVWNSISSFIGGIVEKITNTVSAGWNAVSNFTSSIFDKVKSIATNIWESIKSKITSIVESIKSTVSIIWESIKAKITSVVDGISSTVSNVWNGIKSTTSNVFNSIKSTATSVWNSIKSAIEKPINMAKNTVKNVIDSIKGFFDFEWSLPKLKLPHLSIKGEFSLMPPKVPSFGIEWYKDGGIMEKPTLFGFNPFTGKGMVGGEAGAEAITPISVLKDYVREAVREENANNYLIVYVQKLIDMLATYFPQIVDGLDRPIILDDGTLVSRLAPQMNAEFGEINKGRERGR